jgi:DsbC/DsbD-like thiol-disulfide interchange protein/cytochrome c biogenesis protein CcdA
VIRRLLIFAMLMLWPALAQAQHIRPELVAEGPALPGGEVELAILMHTSPGWHGYWLNPGEAGLPMTVDWQLPKGASVGPLRYPVPTRLTVAGLMNYVYERDYAVLARLKVPAAATGTIPIRANAHWLACTEQICVPEQGAIAVDVASGEGASRRGQFDIWRQALPRPLAAPAHFELRNGMLRLAIPFPRGVGVSDPYIFPATDGVVDYESPQKFFRSGDTLVAELKPKGKTFASFEGLFAYDRGRGLSFAATPGAVPQDGTRIGSLGRYAVLWAVFGALAGGILLNLMPCVFPILALKVLHVTRAGDGAREARFDALSYAAGAVIGTGLLGATLLLIRAAGAEAGWAFQLQDPRTILLLLLLAVAITANLIGLFELPVLGGGARPAGSFGTGALAAFVATPCAGPFLGTALGTALLLPTLGALLVFAALGLGLALPFVLLAFIPALRHWLPKPGPWMRRLQRFLAIPMAASALAVLWLLHRLGGTSLLLIGLVITAAILLLLWIVGLRQRQGRAGALAAGLAALALSIAAVALIPSQTSSIAHATAGAETWSEGQVAGYVAQHKPVFVYFTADWCLTCKVNEVGAIDRSEVRDAFRAAGVKVLAGDWTNGDPTITRFLEGRGRAGVPFYLWYAPGKPPEELPQVLTPSLLIGRAQAIQPAPR